MMNPNGNTITCERIIGVVEVNKPYVSQRELLSETNMNVGRDKLLVSRVLIVCSAWGKNIIVPTRAAE